MLRGDGIGASREGTGVPTFVLARALVYATLFAGLLLFLVPARIRERSGIDWPSDVGGVECAGIALAVVGGALAVWCVLIFALLGHGTPAPFDAPRRLVAGGPYRYVRNPMYVGAILVLCGAALFHRSTLLLVYATLFLILAHVFVVLYEEPTLMRLFRGDYEAYRARVGRWLPRLRMRRDVDRTAA